MDAFMYALGLMLELFAVVNIALYIYYDIKEDDVKAIKHSVVAVMLMVVAQGVIAP